MSESGNGFITSLGSVIPAALALVLEFEAAVPESAAAVPEVEEASGAPVADSCPAESVFPPENPDLEK